MQAESTDGATILGIGGQTVGKFKMDFLARSAGLFLVDGIVMHRPGTRRGQEIGSDARCVRRGSAQQVRLHGWHGHTGGGGEL